MAGRHPDFLIIGAQKCGTSWIHSHLSRHPEIFLFREKDAGHFFFTTTREQTLRQAYLEGFENAGAQHRALGETSAAYFWTRTGCIWDGHPINAEDNIPQRIRQELGGDMKFVLCLRDPIDRALSAYIHHLRTGDFTFDDSVLTCGQRNGTIEMGFYARHLTTWLGQFDRRQFLILNFERDIVARPVGTLGRIFSFLGVNVKHETPFPQRPVFPGMRRVWRNQALLVTDRNGRERKIADQETVRELQNIYRADVAELDRILSEKFSAPWRTVHAII